MNDFSGKVAVITGAAGGLGLGLAEHALTLGMKLVLADVQEGLLEETAESLRRRGADLVAVSCDVSIPEDVNKLCTTAFESFGVVHLLINNAGVGCCKLLHEYTLEDWRWVLETNLWGVIHGIRFFVPRMLEQNVESQILNVSSSEALLPGTGPGGGAYGVGKAAVIHLSEVLRFELESQKPTIGVSVLCPGLIHTDIFNCDARRPERYDNDSSSRASDAKSKYAQKYFHTISDTMPARSPRKVAEIAFEGIRNRDLYIFSHGHPSLREVYEERFDAIMNAVDNSWSRFR